MRIDLKSFQETAAKELLAEVGFARREINGGKHQAIVLSSPTGSGKTVIITQLLEWIWKGDEEKEGDKQAVFLWLSDSPELNAQSLDKIARQSSVFAERDLEIIEPPFNEERLQPGKVYFLNTQKLSKSSLLTKPGDGHEHTIWETIENTIKAAPEHLYLVIDEAHRGTAEGRVRTEANSIMQRFVKGYPEGGMSPVPLVIGMSATPERFENLIAGANRTKRQHTINPQNVKESGLLKEKIILYHPETNQPADWSLLEQAVKRWQDYGKHWKKYCGTQSLDFVVDPVLVIQVEDGSERQLSKTKLDEIVKVVERVAGKLPDAAWAHAFQEDTDVEAGGKKIRKIEASKIETDGAVRVVLFKMSLSTGWDCPRAEVMMSFRKAVDHTLIAQLIGRMVRTPLARKIEGNELLNTVALFLPHYDSSGLKRIVDTLNSPDPESGLAIEVEEGTELIPVALDSKLSACVELYQSLPSYRVERVTKISNVKRLMKFVRYLAQDEVDTKVLDQVKDMIVQVCEKELKRLKKNKSFVGNIEANQQIDVTETWIGLGDTDDAPEQKKISIKATEENIEDLFSTAGRKIGEGLHMECWRARKGESHPLQSKLEVIGLIMEPAVLEELEELCGKKLEELQRKFDAEIKKLSTSDRERYNAIRRVAKDPQPETLLLPPEMEVKDEDTLFKRHLYVNKKGEFPAKFNKWETTVLNEFLEDKSVVGWVRITPRKDWALCIPYEKGNERHPLYPDFVVFRKEGKRLIADIYDPHGTQLDEAVEKAKGMSKFARDHGLEFGRIEMIVMIGDELKRLDVNNEKIRDRIDSVTSKAHLDDLFQELG